MTWLLCFSPRLQADGRQKVCSLGAVTWKRTRAVTHWLWKGQWWGLQNWKIKVRIHLTLYWCLYIYIYMLFIFILTLLYIIVYCKYITSLLNMLFVFIRMSLSQRLKVEHGLWVCKDMWSLRGIDSKSISNSLIQIEHISLHISLWIDVCQAKLGPSGCRRTILSSNPQGISRTSIDRFGFRALE